MAHLNVLFLLSFLFQGFFQVNCNEIGRHVISGFENQQACTELTDNGELKTNILYKKESTVLIWGKNEVILAKRYKHRINILSTLNKLEFCFMNISRKDAGEYTWKDIKGKNNSILLLNVWYGPTEMLLSPNMSAVETLNESLYLESNCSAVCYPDCLIHWVKNQEGPISNSNILVLENVSKTDRGNYTCIAANVADKNHNITAGFEIYVNYGAKINFTMQGNRKEYSNIHIACSVDSYPASNISLMKDNRELVTSLNKRNEVLLNFRNASCDDAGNYECSAYNGFGTKETKEFQLDILCKPRFVGEKTTYAFEKKIKALIEDEIKLNVIVQAYPSPEVKLVLHDVNVSISRLSYTVFHVQVRKFISSVSDFRLYSVTIGNEEGIVTIALEVQRYDRESSIDFKFVIGISLSILTFLTISIILILYEVRRQKQHRENQSFGNSEAIYVNTEFEATENISEISFDEAYVFQNRIREIELAATTSYENLSVTEDETEYEEMEAKKDSSISDVEYSDCMKPEGSRTECSIKVDEDGYLISTDNDAKTLSSERQSEELHPVEDTSKSINMNDKNIKTKTTGDTKKEENQCHDK